MNARHTDALDRAIVRIVDTMQPEAIYLFGSHAEAMPVQTVTTTCLSSSLTTRRIACAC
jgi:hypothetical protein